MLALNNEAPLPTFSKFEVVANDEEDDDGVAPLTPCLAANSKCALKLNFDSEASTSNVLPSLSPASPASSDTSTPPSSRNRPPCFSPLARIAE